LQRAVINNKKQLIKYFIDKGIDPNEKNDKGNTAMHLAMLNDDEDTIQMILDAGGNLYIKNNDDDTPIDLASKYILKKYESIIN
jgi:ankyrin repeat protein